MSAHLQKPRTPEEVAWFTIPSPHLAKLVSVGHIVMTDTRPKVSGDGLIRMTESE